MLINVDPSVASSSQKGPKRMIKLTYDLTESCFRFRVAVPSPLQGETKARERLRKPDTNCV